MNKHLGHVLVLAAFVGLGNGLGGGPGGGGAAGRAGGPPNAGAGGSPSDSSRSGLEGSGNHPPPKNASLGLGSSSGGGGGGVGGSSGESEGLGGHTLSGGSGMAGAVGAAGSSSGVSESSSSARSPSSVSSVRGLDLTGGFGAGAGGVGVPGGGASDFGGFGGGSRFGSGFGNFNSGFGSSSGGAATRAGGSDAGAGGFGGDQFSGGDLGFENDFGQTWGANGSPGNSFITRGSLTGSSGFPEGRPGDIGELSSEGNSYDGEGAPVFGGFNAGSEFGSIDSGFIGGSPFGMPAGAGEGLGTDRRGSVGGAGALPLPFHESEPGDFLGSQAGHGDSFPSSSGFVGSPSDEGPTDLGSSSLDANNNPSNALVHGLGGFPRPRLLPRLWSRGRTARGPFGLGQRRRKTDARVAAAVALGTVAGLAAIGSIGASIAAAVHARRRSGAAGLGRARRGCVSGDCHRKRRSIPASKIPAEILDGIAMNFERL